MEKNILKRVYTLLCSRNGQNIVNQLYFNFLKKSKILKNHAREEGEATEGIWGMKVTPMSH